VSVASTVTLNALPAVWVAGVVGMVRVLTEPEDTVKVAEPVIVPWVAVSVVLPALERVIEAVPTPLASKVTDDWPVAQVPLTGYAGGVFEGAGELVGPLKAMHWAPVKPLAPLLSYVSRAVIVSVKAVPAVGVGVDKVKLCAPAGLTVNVAEPVIVPWVAVSVVLTASERVIEAVPTPLALKVTDDWPVAQVPLTGYAGGVFDGAGELVGPLKAMHWAAVKPLAALSYVSNAVIVSLNEVPAVGVGVDKVKLCAPAGLTVKVPETPEVAPADATVSVVFWASKRVMLAVPTPLVKVIEAG